MGSPGGLFLLKSCDQLEVISFGDPGVAFEEMYITCACSTLGGSCYLWGQDCSSSVLFPTSGSCPDFGSGHLVCIPHSGIISCNCIQYYLWHSCWLW